MVTRNPNLFSQGAITHIVDYSDPSINYVRIAVLEDVVRPSGRPLEDFRQNFPPHAMDNYHRPYHVPITVIRLSEDCPLQTGDRVDVVPVEVQTTVEQCPLAIEGYVGPLGDLEEEMPEDYEWGNEAVLEPSDLPNLALVTWNEVVALDSRRCSMCPALIKASCLLFQTAKKLRSSGVQ